MTTFKNYYQILQIDPAAEQEVIVAAYRRLALKYHPDLNKSSEALQRMKEINEAYRILGDSTRRTMYDIEQRLYGTSSNRSDFRDTTESSNINNSRKEDLLIESDFYQPSTFWGESHANDHKVFRQEGHYHIVVMQPSWQWYQYPQVQVTDFRVTVDAQFTRIDGNYAVNCGIVFRLSDNKLNTDDYYLFSISASRYYTLHLSRNNEWVSLLDWRYSQHIKPGGAVNSLAVEMVGSRMKICINGHVLTEVIDTTLSHGFVGLVVGSPSSLSYAETRFRDFRLYSIKID